jgi:hypothetical protein
MKRRGPGKVDDQELFIQLLSVTRVVWAVEKKVSNGLDRSTASTGGG